MSILVADAKSHHLSQIPSSCPIISPIHKVVDLGSSCSSQHQSQLNGDPFDQNTLIAYVYCFVKNYIGASGVNSQVLDKKIEQAMVLLKNHLMLTVREEVEVLKDKISELIERVSELENENAILKANATTETLSQLRGGEQIPSKSIHHLHCTTASLNSFSSH